MEQLPTPSKDYTRSQGSNASRGSGYSLFLTSLGAALIFK